MKVDIVIPNYNGAQLIEKNLPSVIAALQKYEGNVIIVDDGSTEEDKINLRRICEVYNEKKVQLFEHGKNKGFSSAVNTGVKHSEAKYVVLLNSDVVPSENFLQSPISHLEADEKLFAVGCMDESIEDEKTVLRGRGIGSWKRGMAIHSKGEVDASDTFWVSGGSSIFRRNLYEILNGMDEIYNPFYWEDIDLSYRAQKSGYSIMFDNKSVVKHFHESGAIKTNFTEAKVTTTAYRNQFIFIWKNITSSSLLMSHFAFLPIHLASSIKGGDLNLIKGLFLAMERLPDIMKKRKKQRKLYVISDERIFEKHL